MHRLAVVCHALSRKEYAALVLLVVLAAVLRLYRLGTDSLWIDEGYSLHDAADLRHVEKSRPLYYVLLHFWMKLGYSEVWLRLPSVLFGVGCVVMLYLLTRELFGRRTGLIASLLMAISPLHINHSQEIRMYTIAVFFVLVEVYFLLQFLKSRSTKHLAASMAWCMVAGLTHPLTLLMLPAMGLFLVLTYRDFRTAAIRWISVQSVLGLLCIPAAGQSLQSFGGKWTWVLEKPDLFSVVLLMRDFTMLLVPRQFPTEELVGQLCGVFVTALVCFGAVAAYRRSRWQVIFAATWLAVPIGLTMLVSHYLDNIWIVRYMLYASPACYMLAAVGISSIGHVLARRLILAGLILLVSSGVGAYYSGLHNPEWRSVTAYIEKHQKDGDAIGIYTKGNIHAFAYYYRGKAPYVGLGRQRLSREVVTGLNDERISEMLSDIPSGSRRTWFVFLSPMNLGEDMIEAYIRRNYRVVEMRHFSRVDVIVAVPARKEDGDR